MPWTCPSPFRQRRRNHSDGFCGKEDIGLRIRIKQLWKIPLYCVLAGWVSFQVIVYATAWFAVVMLPDGSYTVDRTRAQFFYILVFVAAVSIGGFLFRRMTKKEIFCSATIIVAFQMLMTLVQWGMLEGGDPNVLLFLYFY